MRNLDGTRRSCLAGVTASTARLTGTLVAEIGAAPAGAVDFPEWEAAVGAGLPATG